MARKKTDPESATEAPKDIPEREKVRLWTRAGGRCQICNTYLLEDEFLGIPYINLAQMAHMVARRTGGPRGTEPLPLSERNKTENLMLLCAAHHKIIDTGAHQEEFNLERLQQMKQAHEDRIRHATGLGPDRQSLVLRSIGKVRGSTTELSSETVRQVLLRNADRYPHFPRSSSHDVEIELRHLAAEGSPSYWKAAMDHIDETLDLVADGVRKGEARHLSVFAFARIPLLVYLGYRLDDKVPTDIYQKHREGDEGWAWDATAGTVHFDWACRRGGSDPAKVVLLLSVSGTVGLDTLPDNIDAAYSVYEIVPEGVTPHRDILRSRSSLDQFAATYHRFLSMLETQHKAAREIHLFAAMPLSAAVVCGRGLMREAQPALVVYDRENESYAYALTVNAI